MSPQPYLSSLDAYERALAALYAHPPAAMAERSTGDVAVAGDLPARAQEFIDRSADLGEAAAAGLRSAREEDRELAGLRLLAAAAADLAVANDLARRAEGPAAAA